MSNEQREQQMMAAAERYAEEVNATFTGNDEEKHQERLVTMNDFAAGWQEADKSRWIPVKERLPEPNIYKEGKTFPLVLVCLNDGCEDTDAYDTDNKSWCKYDGEVAYWMDLPEAPRKEE